MAGLAIPIVLRIAFCSLMAFKPKSLLTASVAGLLGASMSTVNRVIYVHFKTHTTLNAYQLHYLQEIWLHTVRQVALDNFDPVLIQSSPMWWDHHITMFSRIFLRHSELILMCTSSRT